MTTDTTYYTIAELAALSKTSRKTVWAWIKAGKIKSIRFGSLHRVTGAEWQEFIERNNQ